MSEQHNEAVATTPNEQIRQDLLEARKHIPLGPNAKSWQYGETQAEIYDQLIEIHTRKIVAGQAVTDVAQNAAHQHVREPLRMPSADELQRAVHEVEMMRDLSYAASKDRQHIIKQNGEPDARDNLREGYNALIKHMQDHPEVAGHDVAVMNAFKVSVNHMAHEHHWTEDRADNALANMMKAHVTGLSQERAIALVEPEQGPSR